MIFPIVKILIIFGCLMGLFLTPTYATCHHYPVHYVIDKQSHYEPEICPYIDIGYHHSGNWRIWGWVSYNHGRSKVQYNAGGIVLPIFQRYWGYHLPVPGFYNCAFDSVACF